MEVFRMMGTCAFYSFFTACSCHPLRISLLSFTFFLNSLLLGFMFGRNVLDKDGVSAAVVAAEMRLDLELQGLTFAKKLDQLHNM